MKKEKTLSFYYGIGQRIQKEREKLGINQQTLANKVFISFRTLQNYEANTVNPKLDVLKKLAQEFDCSLEYLLFGKSEEEIIEEEYNFLTNIYKNSEELKEINKLILSFNHKIDNIDNPKIRKEIINQFSKSIKKKLEFFDYYLNVYSKNNNELIKVNKESNLISVQTDINELKFLIDRLHKDLRNAYKKLDKLYEEYYSLIN